MEIISSSINKDSIQLVTNSPVAGYVLSYGKGLSQVYNSDAIPGLTELTITKEALGVDSLDNTYFKVYLYDTEYEYSVYTGIYNLDIENNKSQHDYDALTLKQELDNLNYYHGIIESLTQKEKFLEANDFFFNYIDFLEKKLNGNNFIQNIKRQGHLVPKPD